MCAAVVLCLSEGGVWTWCFRAAQFQPQNAVAESTLHVGSSVVAILNISMFLNDLEHFHVLVSMRTIIFHVFVLGQVGFKRSLKGCDLRSFHFVSRVTFAQTVTGPRATNAHNHDARHRSKSQFTHLGRCP